MSHIDKIYKNSGKEFVATIHIMVPTDNVRDAHQKLSQALKGFNWMYASIPSNTKSLPRLLKVGETTLPMQVPTHTRTTVYYLQDDIDYIEDGDVVRKAYGVGIYNAITGDLIERVYASGETQAENLALKLCMACGWNILHPEEVSPYDIVMPGYAP